MYLKIESSSQLVLHQDELANRSGFIVISRQKCCLFFFLLFCVAQFFFSVLTKRHFLTKADGKSECESQSNSLELMNKKRTRGKKLAI